MLLLHAIFNLGSFDWSKPLAFIWIGLLVLAMLLALGILARLGALRIVDMPTNGQASPSPASPGALSSTPPAARLIGIFIFALTGLVGGTLFFLPDFGRERWPWDLANTTNVQLLGAVFLSVSLGSLLSVLQPSWFGFDVFYPAAGTFSTVALIASFMHWNLFAAKPITSVVFVIIYLVGAVMGFYPYFRYALRYGRWAAT
jgi:hypothetical protein